MLCGSYIDMDKFMLSYVFGSSQIEIFLNFRESFLMSMCSSLSRIELMIYAQNFIHNLDILDLFPHPIPFTQHSF